MKKSFKALFVADIHMSNKLSYSKPTKNGLTDRFEDQLILLDRIKEIAEQKKVDKIFILGDLFDKSLVDAVTLTHTITKIVDYNCPVAILPGNHEANTIKGGRFVVEAFDAMKKNNLEVLGLRNKNKLEVKCDKGIINFWSIKYKTIEETKDDLKKIRKDLNDKQQNILLIHNSIIGSTHMSWLCDEGLDARKDFKGFDLILAGHFHKKQSFSEPSKISSNGFYLGAPMQHNFSDSDNNPGLWFLEFNGDTIKKEFIENDFSPRFFIFRNKDIKSFESLNLLEHKINSGDYLRFVFEATYPEWIKQKNVIKIICDDYKNKNIKASFLHQPISQHKTRLDSKKDLIKILSIESSIEKYVDAISVTTKGLNLKRLKTLGQDILKAKIKENAIS